jgi:endonuclease/exonuclease/phosphatase family metal-dependent hydrolase
VTARDCIRIATYNVHKCRGLDRRIDPARIASVIHDLDADVVALQEVVGSAHAVDDQVRYIAERAGSYEWCFGENRFHLGRPYGNAILSRRPIQFARNYDLTSGRRERRGCLRADVLLDNGSTLHLFNVHLGTSFFERRHQARRLVSREVLGAEDLSGPRIVVGDFNEWTRGLASHLMSKNFQSVDLRAFTTLKRTYPGLVPLLHLDHFYFDDHLILKGYHVERTRRALVASDHLPLVAEFRVRQSGVESK